MKKLLIIYTALLLASCEQSINSSSELLNASLEATTDGNKDWEDLKSRKSFYELKIFIGDKLLNSVDQIESIKKSNLKKTETFQKKSLSEIVLINNETSAMVKFDSGEFFGLSTIPREKVSLFSIANLQKFINDFYIKDTVWSEKPVYQLVNDSIDEEYIFDKESKYLIAFISKSLYGHSITTYSNYKNVDGYFLPFKEVVSIPKAGYKTVKDYSKIEVNPDFQADYFELQKSWNRLRKGSQLPNFELPYLIDSTQFISKKDISGKITLIDFWATWCKPCLEEFPNIKEYYEKYKEEGFEVVSISVDKDKSKPLAFSVKNPFPWKYSLYSEGQLQSDLAKDFQIAALPKPILIDETGEIIAMDAELREGKLGLILKDIYSLDE